MKKLDKVLYFFGAIISCNVVPFLISLKAIKVHRFPCFLECLAFLVYVLICFYVCKFILTFKITQYE